MLASPNDSQKDLASFIDKIRNKFDAEFSVASNGQLNKEWAQKSGIKTHSTRVAAGGTAPQTSYKVKRCGQGKYTTALPSHEQTRDGALLKEFLPFQLSNNIVKNSRF